MERVMTVDALIGYQGGQMVLLYSNTLLVYGCAAQLVLTSLCGVGDTTQVSGLWKAFTKTPTGGTQKQAFLKGHSGTINFIQVICAFSVFDFLIHIRFPETNDT
jgi:hypothetical protein